MGGIFVLGYGLLVLGVLVTTVAVMIIMESNIDFRASFMDKLLGVWDRLQWFEIRKTFQYFRDARRRRSTRRANEAARQAMELVRHNKQVMNEAANARWMVDFREQMERSRPALEAAAKSKPKVKKAKKAEPEPEREYVHLYSHQKAEPVVIGTAGHDPSHYQHVNTLYMTQSGNLVKHCAYCNTQFTEGWK